MHTAQQPSLGYVGREQTAAPRQLPSLPLSFFSFFFFFCPTPPLSLHFPTRFAAPSHSCAESFCSPVHDAARKRPDAEAGAEEAEDQRLQASAGLLEEALLCPLHDPGRAVERSASSIPLISRQEPVCS